MIFIRTIFGKCTDYFLQNYISFHPVHIFDKCFFKHCVPLVRKQRIVAQQTGCDAPCLFENLPVSSGIGKREAKIAALPDPKEIARTPKLKVFLGDRKAVVRRVKDFEPLSRFLRFGPLYENAVGLICSARKRILIT